MRPPTDGDFGAALALSFLASARKAKPQLIDSMKAEIAEWNRQVESRKAAKKARSASNPKATP